MAAALSAESFVGVEIRRIRLDWNAVFRKTSPSRPTGIAADKVIRFVENFPKPPRHGAGVDRPGQGKVGVVVGSIPRVAADLRDQALGGISRVLSRPPPK